MNNTEKFVFDILGDKTGNTHQVDFAETLRILKLNRVVPLFYYKLKRQNITCLPEFVEELKNETQQRILRTLTMEAVIGQVLELFRKNQVEVVVLKGFALASRYYPEMHLRSMSDIDLLIRSAQFERASQLLIEAGGVPVTKNEPRAMEVVRHDRAFMLNGVLIEIHRHIIPQNENVILHVDDLFRNTGEVDINGKRALTFTPELTLFYMLYHFERHAAYGLTRLSWLADVHQFFTYLPQTFNSGLFFEWIRVSKVEPSIYYALQMCSNFLGTSFPFPVPELKNTTQAYANYLQLCVNKNSKNQRVGSFTVVSRMKGFMPRLRYVAGKLFPGRFYIIERYKLKDSRLWFFYHAVLYISYARKWLKNIR